MGFRSLNPITFANRNSINPSYNTSDGTGFRNMSSYFNLPTIAGGPQVINHTDLSNYVPSYVPPPPPAAPVYTDDGGGGYDPGDGDGPPPPAWMTVDIGIGSDWNNPYVTPPDYQHVVQQPNDPGSVGGHANNGSDDWSDNNVGDVGAGGSSNGHPGHGGFDGGSWWNTGGTIPPMYANQGMIATNDPYPYSREQLDRIQAQTNAKNKASMDAMLAKEQNFFGDLLNTLGINTGQISDDLAEVDKTVGTLGQWASDSMFDTNLINTPMTLEDRRASNQLASGIHNIGTKASDYLKGQIDQKVDEVNKRPEDTVAKAALGTILSNAIGSSSFAPGIIGGMVYDSMTGGMSKQQKLDKIDPRISHDFYNTIYDNGDDYGYTPNEITAIEQAPSYGVNLGTVPNIDMTDYANYNIKDFVGIPEVSYTPAYATDFGDIYNAPVLNHSYTNLDTWDEYQDTIAEIQAEIAEAAAGNYNSSNYDNDAGYNAPSGGYPGYSGSDVEDSYSVSDTSGPGHTNSGGMSDHANVHFSRGGYINPAGGK